MSTALQLGLSAQSQVDWLIRVVKRVRSHPFATVDQCARACDIAIAVVLTESNAYMYANRFNPRSMQLPHDRVGSDHGSVGLYQQQVGGASHSTADWGTTDECMNAEHSTDSFLFGVPGHHGGLLRLGPGGDDWLHLTNWLAAQRVQGSSVADGGNYRLNDAHAIQIRKAIWNATAKPVPAPNPHAPVGTYRVQKGDTLSAIARRYPQRWITPDSIANLNKIRNANLIYAGQSLLIG